MSIRDAARQAWIAARSGREDEARDYLAGLLEPFDVATLATVHVDAADTYTLFVLLDEGDDVHLAVRTHGDGWEAFVVTDAAGWTLGSERIRSLAHLHELLPEAEPDPEPDPEPEYPEWTEGVVYRIGDRVTHEGATWEAVQGDGAGNNVWQPGPGGYGWQKVSG